MSMSSHFEFNSNDCLPPFGWSEFAWKNLELIKPDNLSVAVYSPSLFATIAAINAHINCQAKKAIDYNPIAEWKILGAGEVGCCHDIALTKWHALKEAGISTCSRLLWEVIPAEFPNQLHLVCLLRTDKMDFVMDNLIDGPPIVWFARNFETLSIMSPDDPNKWLIPLKKEESKVTT